MGAISIRNVVKRYGKGPKANQVIHDVSAEIADGEFIVIVGPSGCGKSTLLRMVAGLEVISAGGSMASIAVAISAPHSVWASPPEIMRLMPITTGYMRSSVDTSSGQRY